MPGQISILDAAGRPIHRARAKSLRGTDPRLDILQYRGTYGMTGYGYRSAATATAEGRSYSSYSGDRQLDFHRKILLAHSRDLWRNNGIYKGIIERAVSYIVGNGFGLRVKTSSAATNRKVEGLWRQWWRRPEIRGILTGPQVARMICREILVAGDHGIIKTDKATIRLIEAEQIDHKIFSDGIDKDDFGAPQTFYVAPYSSSGVVQTSKATGVKAGDFIFLTDPCRPSQTRGVPALQSSFPMLHRINDVCDSEAISWQLLARYAITILREGGPSLGYDESGVDDDKADAEGDDTTTRVTELDYALIFHGEPGDEVKGIERNIPGKDFPASIRMFLRLLGLPLGIPLEIILLDWTQSNYSQSRAVLEQAYETFQSYQDLLEEQCFTPLLNWKLGHWSADVGTRALTELQSGLRSDGGPSYEWIRPTYPWLDQLKEAQAHAAKLDRTLTTHAHVLKSQKLDREDVLSTRRTEVEEAIQMARQIEERFPGAQVPWQIFAGLPAPAATPAATAPQDQDEEPGNEENRDEPRRKNE